MMSALYDFSKSRTARLFRDDEGQAAFEYVMLLVLFAIAAFITSPSMTDSIRGAISGISRLLAEGMTS